MKANFWSKATFALLLSASVSAAIYNCPATAADVQSATAAVGKPAPAFTLTDSNGKKRSLSDASGKIVVLEWINFGCPFVQKHYKANNMQKLQKTYTGKGVVWYSICSSAEGRQGSFPAQKINELLKENNSSSSAYLFDPDGAVGHAYGATATPHMFVINQKGILVYAGAIDDNPSADISDKAGTNYVQKALDELIANKPISTPSTQAYGCSVKYAK
jgi:peroxiredoxin